MANKFGSYSDIKDDLENKGIKFLDRVNYRQKSEDGVTVQVSDCFIFKGYRKTWTGIPEFDSKSLWDIKRLKNIEIALKRAVQKGYPKPDWYVDLERAFLGDMPSVTEERKTLCCKCAGLLKSPVQWGKYTLYLSRPDGADLTKSGYSSFWAANSEPYHMVYWAPNHGDIEFPLIKGLTEPITHISYLYGHPHAHYFRQAALDDNGYMKTEVVTPLESYIADSLYSNVHNLSKNPLNLRSPANGGYPPAVVAKQISEDKLWVLGVNMMILCYGMVFPSKDIFFWIETLHEMWDRLEDEIQNDFLTKIMLTPGMTALMKERYKVFCKRYADLMNTTSDLDVSDILAL